MAPARPKPPSRKHPTQRRAKVTVDAILRATAHILKAEGFAACSTNAVARRAGVSIGSLYQYFSSKEALVAALAEQHAESGQALLLEMVGLAALEGPQTIEAQVRRYIEAMVRLHADDAELHRVLMQQVPSIPEAVAAVNRVSNRSGDAVRAWLESRRDELRPLDPAVATFVLVTSVEAVTHLQLMERPKQLDVATLVDELTWLVLGYLGVASKPARRRRQQGRRSARFV
ncbi:MAG: TetR/AcrR family transcriptional regulator [Myxococcaceae bacterium]|nr:TetR/AcrR family transcriptional regulator [Myxococcaceae bacterium]